MNTKEKHIRENENRQYNDNEIANSLRAHSKVNKNESTKKVNNLWLWFGVLVLIFILLFWLFSMGIFGDLTSYFNG